MASDEQMLRLFKRRLSKAELSRAGYEPALELLHVMVRGELETLIREFVPESSVPVIYSCERLRTLLLRFGLSILQAQHDDLRDWDRLGGAK